MIVTQSRLVVFTRYPEAGRTKSRLIPLLGAKGAAALHRELAEHTFRTVAPLATPDLTIEVRYTGGDDARMRDWLGNGYALRPQADGDLGRRMAAAMDDAFADGATTAVLIGTDCPGLTAALIVDAFRAASAGGMVFGPARDGGYYLVGLSAATWPAARPAVFEGIAWGTDAVLRASVERAASAGFKPALLTILGDIDRPEDVPLWTQRDAT
jgi:rSAM/selenodomain-associated transferase 1